MKSDGFDQLVIPEVVSAVLSTLCSSGQSRSLSLHSAQWKCLINVIKRHLINLRGTWLGLSIERHLSFRSPGLPLVPICDSLEQVPEKYCFNLS